MGHKERGERNEDRRRGSETENGDSLVTQVEVVSPSCRVELDSLVVIVPRDPKGMLNGPKQVTIIFVSTFCVFPSLIRKWHVQTLR